MCLGIPGKVLEIYQKQDTRMGQVDFGGIVKEVCLEFVPEVQIGDYTIIHVGFAISKLDEASALETLALIEEIGALDEELGLESQRSTSKSSASEDIDHEIFG
jgi:hydrogenase expression/formation protein HypC